MRTKIITDSLSDITKDVAETFDIEVIPVGVSLSNNLYTTDNLDVSDTVKWIEKNKKAPEFKGINTDTFKSIFKKYINQNMEIIYLSAGSGTISNYDSACHASTYFPNANIHVIDTHHASGTLAMMVLTAAKLAQNNDSANAIVIHLERTAANYKHYGLTNTVEFLKYSGLCPKIIAVGVNLLNAKFEITMKEDNTFDAQIVGTSMEKAISNYLSNIFKNLQKIDPKIIFIMHTINEGEDKYFLKLYRNIEDLQYFQEIIVCGGGHHTTSLVGKGGFSVAYKLK